MGEDFKQKNQPGVVKHHKINLGLKDKEVLNHNVYEIVRILQNSLYPYEAVKRTLCWHMYCTESFAVCKLLHF